jgi:hypothetical protein
MKMRTVLACVVAAGVLSILIWLLASQQADIFPERPGSDTRDNVPVEQIDVLARSPPAEPVAELFGSEVDGRPRWIRAFPNIELDGRTAESVLTEFWGSEWPVVREHILLNMGGRHPEMQEGVLSLLAADGPYDPSSVGDLDEFLKALPSVLIGNYDRERINGVHAVAFRATALGRPFGMSFTANELLQPAVARRMTILDPAKPTVPVAESVEEKTLQIMLRHGVAIQSALDELRELAIVLGQDVRSGLTLDLEGLSPYVQPHVGNLFVSPLLSTKPMARPGSAPCSGATCLLLHSGGSSKLVPGYWAATYDVNVNDFQTCASTLAAIAVTRKNLADWLLAVIESEVGG